MEVAIPVRPLALLAVLCLALAAAGPWSAGAEEETVAAPEQASAPAGRHPDAPAETEQFGRLVGAWDVTMRVLHEDGTWPEEPLRALWTFEYILDGWAIQDHWISPPPEEEVEGPRQVGTNIRIFNPQAGHWEMAWISNTQQQLSTFEAEASEGTIVMRGEHASGRQSKVTFHDIDEKSFDWRMELQGDEGEGWFEVARIHAERRP